jgi:hypothetical protein
MCGVRGHACLIITARQSAQPTFSAPAYSGSEKIPPASVAYHIARTWHNSQIICFSPQKMFYLITLRIFLCSLIHSTYKNGNHTGYTFGDFSQSRESIVTEVSHSCCILMLACTYNKQTQRSTPVSNKAGSPMHVHTCTYILSCLGSIFLDILEYQWKMRLKSETSKHCLFQICPVTPSLLVTVRMGVLSF